MTVRRGGGQGRGNRQPIFPIGPRRSRQLREPFARRILRRLYSNGTLALLAGIVIGAIGGDLAHEWLHPAPSGSVAENRQEGTPSATVAMMALPAAEAPEPEPSVAAMQPIPSAPVAPQPVPQDDPARPVAAAPEASETERAAPEVAPALIADGITDGADPDLASARTESSPTGAATLGPDREDIGRLLASLLPSETSVPQPPLDAANAPPAAETVLPLPVEVPPPEGMPAWLAYAVQPPEPVEGRAMIAIVIDDVGLNRPAASRAIALPGPITLSFMTYAEDLPLQAAAARRSGHELMLHVPMEPLDGRENAGPDMLGVAMSTEEIRRRLVSGLDRLQGYVGINNHMGSRFTRSPDGMAVVMQELRRRGLLFLDSVTINDSVGSRMAALYGVPHVDRDVFLDNDMNADAVEQMLLEVERIARERGYAIGIGHPHPETLAALARWLPTLRARGFDLVPVSTIVRRVTPATG